LKRDKANTLIPIKELTDVYSRCIHCGMCLTSCPTYDLTGLETSSPRGRIKLIKSVAEGILPVTDTFAYEMNFCLDCQACETACPAGVKFGTMVEAARVEIESHGYHSVIKSFVLKKIIPFKKRIKLAAKLLRFYQKSGLQKFLRSSGILRNLFPELAKIEELTPDIPKESSDSFIKEVNKPEGKDRYRLAFSYGCLMNVLLPEVNKDTVKLLNKIGAVIISPVNQTCCGSLNAHNGDIKTAKKLAEKNIEAFGKYDYDYLISNSAGCGAFMKEYGELFKEDQNLADRAKIFSSKVRDLTEFLFEKNFAGLINNCNKSITYHDACHLVHTQKIFNQPRALLGNIPGLKLIPLEDSTRCCGSAGIYNLIHYDTSMKLLNQKMINIERTKAEVVLTENPGCIIQLIYGVKKFNKNVEIMHPATFLNKFV
jgi:glycolate oxidase iron-sulfur subunit